VTVLLDPTSEQTPASRERLARPDRLEGLTVGLLDISKPRGDVFLDRLDARLTERGITVKRYMKPTVAKPAPLPLRQQIVGEVNVVIEGLADWGSCTSCCTHDLADLEANGIPSVGVATTEFIDAAAAQSKALGTNPAYVFVQHPVQDRTDDELKQLADDHLEAILSLLVKGTE
jgi:hypothetical protein